MTLYALCMCVGSIKSTKTFHIKELFFFGGGSPFLEIVHTCCEFFLLFFVGFHSTIFSRILFPTNCVNPSYLLIWIIITTIVYCEFSSPYHKMWFNKNATNWFTTWLKFEIRPKKNNCDNIFFNNLWLCWFDLEVIMIIWFDLVGNNTLGWINFLSYE